MPFQSLDQVYDDYELLEADERYRLLIDLGRALEPMPDALKTEASLVRGCSASVWVYPLPQPDGRLHFLADSNAAITKGIVALVLLAVQDKTPQEILATDFEDVLARLAFASTDAAPPASLRESLIACIAEGSSPLIDAASTLQLTRVCLAARRSADERRVIAV